ncbi:MAG: NifU family SUF system FeS assembly protein, nitrogen fixation protein NifU [Candidatus Gottesmanbacteria bacterium GW2011_GWA2_43_14]|uniref:NifU family SUF system FeS assembly protein, nitrogen fixation protein NifU n=1 Tax=Candidatus Gottesmanbacteria bacterium GW2011_GWA2_43_14 TaxID=1618443 RepID=A0A0G1DFQ9_9BACT|nr:MAG: NifU family SUF system FeS assembly protein, nitrogen fixation protein NifU [Candidatus Gottesmanbacteria bacterium GW2011_GWA2_43_14]
MDLYRDNILDHYQNPRNWGSLTGSAVKVSHNNPSCGDSITVSLKLDSGKIADIKFTGNGCAISMASASMLTEYIMGKSVTDALVVKREDVEKLLGTKLTLARLKCALLPLETIRQALVESAKTRLPKPS